MSLTSGEKEYWQSWGYIPNVSPKEAFLPVRSTQTGTDEKKKPARITFIHKTLNPPISRIEDGGGTRYISVVANGREMCRIFPPLRISQRETEILARRG